ncbi:cytochrome b [Rhodobacteraceae bacterium RKSG542]|uniref:cytochrome b n=1 Tax=Pseudovibrio flavus TaxID=2529854 RepID=UPI0012BC14E7|nr:cytochrome b/b6 domain-containing protein [Pseudovibrio flavus]MTI16201.1 cytochrome b [Pseudovibrio flavus]
MTRYHPLLVALHWIVAIMIFMALVVGGPMLAEISNSNPDKPGMMAGHMVFGAAVGALILVRLVTRFTTRKPPKADTGNKTLNLAGQAAHWGIYFLMLAMVASGIGLALSADLFAIAFGGVGTLPADLTIYPARIAHGVIGSLLLAMIVLHVLGWAYHQFVLKDRLFSRMWFGKRKVAEPIAAE